MIHEFIVIYTKNKAMRNDVKAMPRFMYEFEGKTRRYYPDLYVPSKNKIIEVKSTYTYLQFRAKNQAKRTCVIASGFLFEFWICDKTTILYRTDGWETDEEVPWYVSGKGRVMAEEDLDLDLDLDLEEEEEKSNKS
jgi:hypothetical protein